MIRELIRAVGLVIGPDEGARQRHLLPFAAGEVHTARELARQLGGVAGRQLRRHRSRAGPGGGTLQSFPFRAMTIADGDVLPHGECEMGEVLVHDCDPTPVRFQAVTRQGEAIQEDFPAGRIIHAREQLDERALAGAVASHHRDNLPRRQERRHILQHRLGALRVLSHPRQGP
jgi:hypothetical protein